LETIQGRLRYDGGIPPHGALVSTGMSDPLALLPLAIAAGGGQLGSFDAAQLVAAGVTLLQRSAPLVRALAGKRSAILLPGGPSFLVALAASDGRGALLLDPGASPAWIAWQLADADVGAVFTHEGLVPLLPAGTPVALLDHAPRAARVMAPGRTMDVDLGSHHGLSLEGDTATEGRDEPCAIWYAPSGRREVESHRALIAAGRAAVAELLLTPVDHVLSVLPVHEAAALSVGVTAPLMAGARVSILSPVSLTDLAHTIEQAVARDGVTMLAAQWRTDAGIRVTAYRADVGRRELRDGNLVGHER
jgi:acyl-CoA synthetase (AMP-forming)/AMP-acid ligase II